MQLSDRIYRVATLECYPVPQQVSPMPPSEHVDADQDEKGKPPKVPSNIPDIIATPPAPEVEELCQYDSVEEMPPLVEVEQTTVTRPSSVTPA